MDPSTNQQLALDMNETLTDFASRTILLWGEINAAKVRKVEVALGIIRGQQLKNEGISILLCSPGGEEGPGFALYDILRFNPTPVTIVGLGEVCSMATLVLQAARKRILMPQCRLLIHAGTYNFGKEEVGQNKLRDIAAEQEVRTQQYATLLASHTKGRVSSKEVYSWCQRETYLSAEEAVKFGLADEVLSYPKTTKETP